MTVLAGASVGDQVLGVLDLRRVPTATLDEVNAAAALQTRVDRKYLVPADVARIVVGGLADSHHLLSVKGRATTTYASLYFDLPGHHSFRAHAQGRRKRWKVRTRLYTEDGLLRLEMKTKDPRGLTVKHGLVQPPQTFSRFSDEGLDFLARTYAVEGFDVDPSDLEPTVRIDYARATLCDLTGGTRLTVDGGLVATLDGRMARISPSHVLVETKGGLRPSPADVLLLRNGVRPMSVSKYAVTLSMLEPTLPGHAWRRTARRYFALAPA